MERALRRRLAGALALLVVLLSPGLEAWGQVARVGTAAGASSASGAAGAAAVAAPLSAGSLAPSLAPALSPLAAPSAFSAPSALAVPSAAAAPASAAPALAPAARAAAAAEGPRKAAPSAAGRAAAPKAAETAARAADSLDAAARTASETGAKPGADAADREKAAEAFDGTAARTAPADDASLAPVRGRFAALRRLLPRSLGGKRRAADAAANAPAELAELGSGAPGSAPAAEPAVAPKSLPARAWAAVSGFAKSAKHMWTGDKDLEHLIAPLKGLINKTRALLVADAALSIGMAFLIGPLLDTSVLAAKHGLAAYAPHLALLSAGLLACFAAYTLVERTHALMARKAGLRGAREYRAALQESLVAQEMDFHLKNGSGALAGRLLNDTNYLVNKNVDIRLTLMYYLMHLTFGVSLLIFTSPLVAAVVLAVVPILGWINSRYGSKLTELSFKQTAQKAELMRYGQESLSQAETVKVFASKDQELQRYGERLEETASLGRQDAKLTANYYLVAGALTQFFTTHLVYILGGAALALGLGLTFGQVTQLTLYAGFAKAAFSGLSSLYLMYKRNEGSSKTVRELLLRKPAIQDAAGATALPAGPGDIRFDDVTFAYPERQAEPVLRGLSFEAKPGQTVAFVGETGSGKSTITRLLLRLWEPTEGRITVDGHEVREVTRASLLSRVAVVPQETRLFNGTLRENMLFGREDATPEELESAIRRAGADYVHDAARFPQGLDTPVAEGGSRLSGGERQRVAIVRALLREPAILILDEATSALDNKSEREVQAALDHLATGAGGRRPTTLVVAHRLSTIRSADRINFLEKGKIVESGTHEELLALNGRYARLWREGGYDSAQAPAAKDEAAKPAETAVAASESAPKATEAAAPAKAPFRTRAKAWAASLYGSMKNFLLGDAEFKPFLASRRAALIGAAVLLILEVAGGLAASNLLGRFLDAAIAPGGAMIRAMELLAGGVTAAFAVVMFVQRQSTWLLGKLRVDALADVRRALMAKLHAKPMSFHLENESAALASRLSEDAESLVKKNVDVRVPILRDLISLVVSTALLLHANLLVGALVFTMIPGLGVLSGYFGQKTEALYTTFGKRRAELGRQGQETLEQIQTIKTFGREDDAVEKYRGKAQALVDVGEEAARIGATSHMFSSALTDFFTRHLIYIAGAWAVGMAFGLSVGAITVMTFYAAFVKGAFDGLSSKWMDYKQSAGETSVVREWLREKGGEDAPGAKPLPPGKGEIVFEGVSFRYSEAQDGGLIDGLDLRIAPGTTVALVGASGSGKSTVLKLLQGLWTPQKGRVLIDGGDQALATRASVAGAIAKVPQETRLFDSSIRYNMTYGSPDATEADLRAAIAAARAEFVDDAEQFPQGLDTQVGEGGAKLSGGQRQRVAIVRALLKKPRILLLDEATSALDKKTEREIQETLDRLTSLETGKKPTTVVVAHNLTTVMGADKIVVLDKGRVVEQGTHAELLAKDGAYARLWAASQQPH